MAEDPLIGRELGGYQLAEVIGRGGMGIVYRASNGAGDVVAIKVIAPELSRSTEFRERFLREAEAALDHPHIVPIYGAGEEEGHLFMRMKLIDGSDLKNLIASEGRLSPGRTATLLAQAAEALDFAHANLLIHRDIKPQNLLVEEPGVSDHVFLTDFGLVKRVSAESSFTSSGHIMGSSPYMAPEQIRGAGVDGRSDVYALGCVLYECLTGQTPYQRDEEVSVLFAHMSEPPPKPSEEVGVLGEGVDAIVAKAMAKDPDERYLTAGDLAAALAAEAGVSKAGGRSPWVAARIAPPRKPAARKSSVPVVETVKAWMRLRGLVGVAAASVILIAGVIQFTQPPGLSGAIQAVADVADAAAGEVGETVLETAFGGDENQGEDPGAAIGSEVADLHPDPASGERAPSDIPRRDREQFRSLLPTDHGSASAGEDPAAQEPAALAPEVGKIVWAKDGLVSDYAHDTDLWVMDADGSNKTRLTTTAAAEFWPSWSPDGRHIAYVVVADGVQGEQDIWVMDSDGTNRQDLGLCNGEGKCGELAWSPDGRRVAYVKGQSLYVADLATGTREPLVFVGVKSPSGPDGSGGTGPTWSPDGGSLAYNCGNRLCLVSANGGEPRIALLGNGAGNAFADPDWSPHRAWMAFGSWSGVQTKAANIFVQRLDGTGKSQLTNASTGRGVGAWAPSWAPDGRALVYMDWSSSQGLLYRVDLDATGAVAGRVQLTSGPADYFPDWWGPPR